MAINTAITQIKNRCNAAAITFSFIRSPGPGGQHVNKVATAVQLRFNVHLCSTLSETVRKRLLTLAGKKVTQNGEIIIKANRFRTQERNKQDAMARLQVLLTQAATTPKKRKKTQPSLAAVQRRLAKKKLHGKNKKLRRNNLIDRN